MQSLLKFLFSSYKSALYAYALNKREFKVHLRRFLHMRVTSCYGSSSSAWRFKTALLGLSVPVMQLILLPYINNIYCFCLPSLTVLRRSDPQHSPMMLTDTALNSILLLLLFVVFHVVRHTFLSYEWSVSQMRL